MSCIHLACSKTVPKRVCASKSMYYVVSRGTSMQSIGTKQPHKPIDHDKVLPACGWDKQGPSLNVHLDIGSTKHICYVPMLLLYPWTPIITENVGSVIQKSNSNKTLKCTINRWVQ